VAAIPALPLAAEQLIPQRPPMLLIQRLLEHGDGWGLAEGCLPKESPFADEGGVLHPMVLVELMAQGYAAVQGYEDLLLGNPVKLGFLVGLRGVAFPGRAFSGERLLVRVRRIGALEGFILAEAAVLRGQDVVSSGVLKLWVSERGPAAEEA